MAGLLGALCAASATLAQVPNTLYMQGLFLNPDGSPNPGLRSFNYAIGADGAWIGALEFSTQVLANADGLANFMISSPSLPNVFQTSTNTYFNINITPQNQQFVTAPYAFQAGNLPMASGNFTVMGDLNVAGNASMLALTAANGAALHAPIVIAKNAYFTNLTSAAFDGSLTDSGGVVMDGPIEANFSTRFSSATATSVFYAATNDINLINATIKQSFTCITNNLPTTGTSGTAAEDGFLIVWITIPNNNKTGGVYVNIGSLQFKLRRYSNAVQAAQEIHMYTGNTFPVAQGTTWSAFLVNAGDSSDITIQCYWIPLRGNG
ncbi:MAG TPA: hypothetical protein DCZ95_18315 [Verrucomicrobia bacterium]|nr:hypothetical protein [Verrucomicrobiota bacterium]